MEVIAVIAVVSLLGVVALVALATLVGSFVTTDQRRTPQDGRRPSLVDVRQTWKGHDHNDCLASRPGTTAYLHSPCQPTVASWPGY